jgi:nucleotide-binding universal stress UspA family protein
LAVPYAPSRFQGAVLAYDGSSKAKEALFVAAYMSSKWHMPLVVVTVGEMDLPYIDEAQDYLAKYNIEATYIRSNSPVATAILEAAQAHECDLIIIGGYGYNAMVAAVMGSTVDELLRRSSYPVLICR